MKTPKYTDGRYPHGYTPSGHTNIRKTFERIKREEKERLERLKAALEAKVQSILRVRNK